MTVLHTVKSKVEILQNFVAFSEYMNFKKLVDGGPKRAFISYGFSKEIVTSDTKAVCDVPTLLKNKESHSL